MVLGLLHNRSPRLGFVGQPQMVYWSVAEDYMTTAELIARECYCVACPDCNGSGSIWVDFNGRYLGNSRCDDLDQLEACEVCRGSGVSEVCENCAEFVEEL